MLRLNKQASLILMLSSLYVCFLLVWLLLFFQQPVLHIGLSASYVIIDIVACSSLFYTAAKQAGSKRSFWLLLVLSCFCMLIGDVLFGREIFWRKHLTPPSSAQLFYAFFLMFLLLAYKYDLIYQRRQFHKRVITTNLAIILIAVLTLDYYLVLQSLLSSVQSSFFLDHPWMMYILGDVLLLFFSVSFYFRSHSLAQKKVLQLLTAALMIYTVTDGIYDSLCALQRYTWPVLLHSVYKLTLLLLALAGAYDTSFPVSSMQKLETKAERRMREAFPYISSLLLGLLALIQSGFSNLFLISLSIILLLILLQQIWTRKENKQLWQQMENLNRSLEQRIELRTQDLLQQKQALFESRQRFKSLYQHHPDAIFTLNTEEELIDINSAGLQLLGYDVSLFTGRAYLRSIYEEDMPTLTEALAQAKEGHSSSFELRVSFTSNKLKYLHLTLVPIVVKDTVVGIYSMIKNITNEKKQQEKIQYLAFHDTLTSLYNRSALLHALNEAIEEAREKQESFCVLFLDLDRFKAINDSLGHSMGDFVLVEVANRLRQCLGAASVIGRLGGDEFTAIIRNYSSEQEIRTLAQHLLSTLQQPIHSGLHTLHVTASIGAAFFPRDGATGLSLLQNADMAMYVSKEEGKNTFSFYQQEINTELQRQLQLERDLSQAFDREELFLLYQPIIHFASKQIVGFEAFIRWQHPELGLIPPGEFISIAEQTDLIYKLGEWTLRKACGQLKKWEEQGYRHLKVGVNISAKEFMHLGIVQTISDILQEAALAPEHLYVELTESIAMKNELATIQTLKQLRALGIQLALDDFGTGYSSLSYLALYPLHTLKIPREFTAMIDKNEGGEAIIASILSLARSLNMSVIAEGIEKKKQIDFFVVNGCYLMQGYHFSKPITPAECEQLLLEYSIR